MADIPDTPKRAPAFKVVICGPSGVGKTCLVHRYVTGKFWKGSKGTIGIDFFLKHMVLDQEITGIEDFNNQKIILQLWDFAGEDRFRKILPVYARGSHGVLLCFDLSKQETLSELGDWYSLIRRYLSPQVPIILMGLKDDLIAVVSASDIRQFLTNYKLSDYRSASSLRGNGVEEAYTCITRAILADYWEFRNQ
ncbi:MAG: Rab family GTPase [Candidatus Hodarchaeales archaeon]